MSEDTAEFLHNIASALCDEIKSARLPSYIEVYSSDNTIIVKIKEMHVIATILCWSNYFKIVSSGDDFSSSLVSSTGSKFYYEDPKSIESFVDKVLEIIEICCEHYKSRVIQYVKTN